MLKYGAGELDLLSQWMVISVAICKPCAAWSPLLGVSAVLSHPDIGNSSCSGITWHEFWKGGLSQPTEPEQPVGLEWHPQSPRDAGGVSALCPSDKGLLKGPFVIKKQRLLVRPCCLTGVSFLQVLITFSLTKGENSRDDRALLLLIIIWNLLFYNRQAERLLPDVSVAFFVSCFKP